MKKIGKKDVLAAFLENIKEERKEGEKTSKEIYLETIQAGHTITLDGVRSRLKRLCDQGKIVMRSGVIDGKQANLYSEP